MSSPLSRTMDLVSRPHPDIGIEVPALEGGLLDEAKRALGYYEAACAPAGRMVLTEWLRELALTLANPPNDEDFPITSAALADTCHDTPMCAVTALTLLKARREFDFWPTGKKLYDFFHAAAAPTVAKRNTLRTIVWKGARQPSPQVTVQTDLTPEQRIEADRWLAQLKAGHKPLRASPEPSGERFTWQIPAPVRTIEEQLAILNGSSGT